MKKLLYSWMSFLIICMLAACEKENDTPPNLASFAIFNAIINGDPVKADFTGNSESFGVTQVEAAYGQSKRFAVAAGPTVPVKVVSSLNFDNVFYNQSFNFQPGDSYSLFLAGEPGNVDTILLKENISPLPDSTMAVQFINCSPSGPVKIVPILVDYYGVSTPQAEISSLGYKENTGFLLFPAPGSLSFYRFELHDPVTDAVLSSPSLEWNIHHTTIVIRGYAGGDPAIRGTRLNYDRF